MVLGRVVRKGLERLYCGYYLSRASWSGIVSLGPGQRYIKTQGYDNGQTESRLAMDIDYMLIGGKLIMTPTNGIHERAVCLIIISESHKLQGVSPQPLLPLLIVRMWCVAQSESRATFGLCSFSTVLQVSPALALPFLA